MNLLMQPSISNKGHYLLAYVFNVINQDDHDDPK